MLSFIPVNPKDTLIKVTFLLRKSNRTRMDTSVLHASPLTQL